MIADDLERVMDTQHADVGLSRERPAVVPVPDGQRRGLVVWVLGLSGSGKTTLCRALRDALAPHVPELVVLDGDAVREAFGNDLGFSGADRRIQVCRLRGLAGLLTHQGMVVLVAAVFAEPALLADNRQQLPGYFEVYLEAGLETLRRRDPKGLYARAAAGRAAQVVGVDIPWCAPHNADLVINMDYPEPAHVLARQVIDAVPGLRRRLP